MIRITAEWTALSIKVRKLDAHLCEATTHGNDVLACMLKPSMSVSSSLCAAKINHRMAWLFDGGRLHIIDSIAFGGVTLRA